MIKNDYIKRILEQIAVVAARLLKLKEEKKHGDALVLLDETMQQLLGISSKTIDSLPHDELIFLIKRKEPADVDRLSVLAFLLKEKGDTYNELDDTSQFYTYYLKALNIILYALNNYEDVDLEKYNISFNEVVNKLKEYVLPEETNISLFNYFEKAGQYSKCEDLIFIMIKNSSNKNSLIDMGIKFYENLKLKNPKELEAGDLPIDEVEDGLKSLIAMS